METLSENYIRSLPKAELHVHLEGSVSAELFLELSRKYESEYQNLSLPQLGEKLFQYRDFSAFLHTYKVVCEHLCEPADCLRALDSLAESFAAQNVRYAEILYTPSIPWKLGRSVESILTALLDRSQEIETSKGIKIRWILDCVRQWGEGPAQWTAELACEFQSRGIIGLGLGGDENSLPMEHYKDVFSWAKAHQLHLHVHAGEIGEPEQVWSAVLVLGANRIGHGIQAARDPDAMKYLREHAIALDVCLTSNVKTHAWRRISAHPFQLLYKRGVPVTLSTDDPGLFQTSLTAEYMKAVRFLGLGREDVHRVILQGVRSSFLPHQDKMDLMQEFQDEIHRVSHPGEPQ